MQAARHVGWLLPSLLTVALCGCNDTRDLAPASPDTPWQTTVFKPGGEPKTAPPGTLLPALASGAVPGHYNLPRDPDLPWSNSQPAINDAHEYSLVELIDIAQRSNKQTRVAWEQARQGAIAVGISQAAYLPQITVDVLGGYQRSVSPFPNLNLPSNLGLNNTYNKGYITSQIEGIFPAVTISYLLLDFGGRTANVQAARQSSFAANVAFTAAHQQLILEVSRSYFQLGAADAQVESAAQSLRNAQLLLDAAGQELRRGEGTVTDVDQARRSVAQARYATAQAATARNASVYSLLSAMGAPPDLKLRVAFPSGQVLPRQVGATVQQLMQTALERRPDLLADLAKLRASQAQVAAARSELFPKVLLSAKGSGKYGQISTENLPSHPSAERKPGFTSISVGRSSRAARCRTRSGSPNPPPRKQSPRCSRRRTRRCGRWHSATRSWQPASRSTPPPAPCRPRPRPRSTRQRMHTGTA